MHPSLSNRVGISAVSVLEPSWVLSNDWFPGMARKFVHHTGIESRPVSCHDEVTMAAQSVKKLQRETGCDLRDCAAVVFLSPSFVPPTVAKKHLDRSQARRESLRRAAKRVVRRLGIADCPTYGLNWFCSGYAKALELVQRRVTREVRLQSHQFILVVIANRISRITNYGCLQTGPLFGDMATTTLLSRIDSPKYPVHFELMFARAEKQPAKGAFFDFQVGRDLPVPTPDGGRSHAAERLVFSLDGMGIADAAPRAMASAVGQALEATGTSPGDIQFVLPHQAGTGIVRFTAMKLETMGVRGEVLNGFTSKVGNVSSCSIPYALQQSWSRVSGLIACPTAAVGAPGLAEVSQGCILLRSTPLHTAAVRAA
jgi:3-oxoacyl-[acyl-carrier-protein] synthase III